MNEYMFYPKQVKDIKIPIEKNRCFVIMPFAEDLDEIYGEIKEKITDLGLICNRADEIAGSNMVMNKVLMEILKAQYIIVDLTHINPNVFYELGIVHTLKNASNVLLIKQDGQETPFDITHMPYTVYSANNLKKLTTAIKKFIEDNKLHTDFYESLNLKGIITTICDNQDEFVYFLENSLANKINIVTNILNSDLQSISELEITACLDEIETIIDHIITSENHAVLDGILNVYYELISSLGYTSYVDRYITRFLDKQYYNHEIDTLYSVSWKTDMAIKLATKDRKLKIIMPWLIDYFTKSKSATIDLNRYKIEQFFMSTHSVEINNSLIQALFHENNYVREHIADIVGEKKLQDAKNTLFIQLSTETNYYTATSFIAAIGKLNVSDGIIQINNWINNHFVEMENTKQYFVLKHAYKAIEKLDVTRDKQHVRIFKDKYIDILSTYNIY